MKKQLYLIMAISALVLGMVGCFGGSIKTPAANNSNAEKPGNAVPNSVPPTDSKTNSNSASNLTLNKKNDKPKTASLEEEIECDSREGGVSSRVKFASGKSSTTINCSVIRGERDTYILGAKAGQKMSVNITSIENNAVFQIENPDGEYLENAGELDDQTKWTGALPAAGDYKIIVGGTRGNASYKLTVTIK